MSPLARIWQVAAGTTVPALIASVALAAGPPQQPTSGSQPAAGPGKPVLLAAKGSAQIARSALLTVDGTATDDSLQLIVRRAADKSVISDGEITVTVEGKNEAVTHGPGGIYEIPNNDLRGDASPESAKDVEIIVPHDGIREILSSKLAVAEVPSSAGSLLGDHKQMAWWILNIVVVLIAATAISRRKK